VFSALQVAAEKLEVSTMKSKLLQALAIVLIIEIGLVHYFTSQHEFEEAAILGYLFIMNFLGALLAAYGIYRRKIWGWGLGLTIALGSLVAYIWSRTSGLPGLEPEAWFSSWGILSLVTESLFCGLAFLRPWRTNLSGVDTTLLPTWQGRYLLPAVGLIALILVNLSTLRLDALFPGQGHEYSFDLRVVQSEPEISLQTFEEKYGVQVSLVAVSAMDSIVDVRLKVLDLGKAEKLFEAGHSALLVGDTILLSPHQHRIAMKEGKPVIIFYPNSQDALKSGMPVSIVFEGFRVQPVEAR
jgi:hypothetical protein